MTEYVEPEQAVATVAHLGLHNRDSGLLFSSLAQNHPLFDGNKRLSWILTLAFLRLNGFRVVMSTDEAFTLVLVVAQSVKDLDEIAAILRRHLVPAAD